MSEIALGLHTDIDAARYHADRFFAEPTLSSGIANMIYNTTPKHAWTAHPRLGRTPRNPTKEMDLGSVAHEIILGKGGGYVVSPFDEFRTKEAKAWRDETLESGATVIKETVGGLVSSIVSAPAVAKEWPQELATLPARSVAWMQK